MITNFFALILIFVAIVSAVYGLSNHPGTKKIFNYFPAPLWCYFLPTLLSAFHILPSSSPLYAPMSRFILPASLILLLVSTDIPALFKLSRKAVLAMLVGSFGIGVGAVATYFPALVLRNKGVAGLQGEL